MVREITSTIRRFPLEDCTAGVMKVHDGLEELGILHTLELPWHSNSRNISCIPQGVYEIRKRTEGEFYNRYKERWGHKFSIHIAGVPDRDWILGHTGNRVIHTRGCVLVGNYFTMDEGKGFVGDSWDGYCAWYDMLAPDDVEAFLHVHDSTQMPTIINTRNIEPLPDEQEPGMMDGVRDNL